MQDPERARPLARRRRTPRVVLVTLLAGAFLAGGGIADAHVIRPVYSSTCKADWKTVAGNEKQIRCFAKYFGVNANKAASVAECESGFRYDAYNGAGPYHGTWQYLMSTWDAHRPHMLPKVSSTSPYQGRHATIVTMRYVRHYGWGAWGCA